MSSSALAAGLRHLCGKLAAQQHNDDSDEQLLYAFIHHRQDSAFAALVRRHGPMVMHVCRRVLGHEPVLAAFFSFAGFQFTFSGPAAQRPGYLQADQLRGQQLSQ